MVYCITEKSRSPSHEVARIELPLFYEGPGPRTQDRDEVPESSQVDTIILGYRTYSQSPELQFRVLSSTHETTLATTSYLVVFVSINSSPHNVALLWEWTHIAVWMLQSRVQYLLILHTNLLSSFSHKPWKTACVLEA